MPSSSLRGRARQAAPGGIALACLAGCAAWPAGSPPEAAASLHRADEAEIRAAVGGGRHVHLVMEHEGNAASLLGAPGYDAQWADDFHHCLHVLLTGEREGYYEDYVDAPATMLATCLAEGFAFQGQMCGHTGAPRG